MAEVDESNASIYRCPITESVANASELGAKGDQTSIVSQKGLNKL